MRRVVQRDWKTFQYATVEIRANRDIALCAAFQDRRALHYVDSDLKNDATFQRQVARLPDPDEEYFPVLRVLRRLTQREDDD